MSGINSWTVTGPDGGPVSSIAIHPAQSLVAITSTERGLYRTTNGGHSWTLVQDGVYPVAQRIVFDPTNLNRVFAVNGNNAQQLEITPAGTMYLGGGGRFDWLAALLLGGVVIRRVSRAPLRQ